MTEQLYDPFTYWTAAGRDTDHPEHESHFVRTDVFARQEEALMRVLEGLTFSSILEVGCGWGRITKLVHDRWPDVPYVAVDLSRERIASARRKVSGVAFKVQAIEELGVGDHPAVVVDQADLVLAVETLMHVPADDIEAAIEKLCEMSSHYVVSLDWSADLGAAPVAPWNARFDYRALYGDRLVSETPTDLQAVFVADVTADRALPGLDAGKVATVDRLERKSVAGRDEARR